MAQRAANRLTMQWADGDASPLGDDSRHKSTSRASVGLSWKLVDFDTLEAPPVLTELTRNRPTVTATELVKPRQLDPRGAPAGGDRSGDGSGRRRVGVCGGERGRRGGVRGVVSATRSSTRGREWFDVFGPEP